MIEALFYNTYFFCERIKNILHHSDDYLEFLDEFYGGDRIYYWIGKFGKHSTLHEFIEFVVEDTYYEECKESALDRRKRQYKIIQDEPELLAYIMPHLLPIEVALKHHNIKHKSFEDYLLRSNKNFADSNEDDVYDYIHTLKESLIFSDLTDRVKNEVFHILFQNRDLMKTFNIMMAKALINSSNHSIPDEMKGFFSPSGKLKRIAIPAWAKRAVFFRDRGRCVLCDKDLSGQINLENRENYDHIVPLANGGFNDISNMQLLCRECNQGSKNSKKIVTSNKYQSWYSY